MLGNLKDFNYTKDSVKYEDMPYYDKYMKMCIRDRKQGDTITLAENEIVTSNVSIYTLYIYIDGNRDNPITMTNQMCIRDSSITTLWREHLLELGVTHFYYG